MTRSEIDTTTAEPDTTTAEPAAPATKRSGEKRLRADARRNRKRIVAAARECFAEHGFDGQVDDIARRANVGVGTVYRHFPTKDALYEALALDRFTRLAEWAREALEDPDPMEGFSGFMYRSAELQANDRQLSEVMGAQPGLMQEASERVALMELVEKLIARAQEAGALRPDVVPEDVPMLMCGLGRATQLGAPGHVMSWQRFLAIVLEGLRAPGTSPLPEPTPQLDA
jgi:AcrR family transcriptional regulator